MGKISEHDIFKICKQFQRLDAGNCGKISLVDLIESHHWDELPHHHQQDAVQRFRTLDVWVTRRRAQTSSSSTLFLLEGIELACCWLLARVITRLARQACLHRRPELKWMPVHVSTCLVHCLYFQVLGEKSIVCLSKGYLGGDGFLEKFFVV